MITVWCSTWSYRLLMMRMQGEARVPRPAGTP